MVSTVIVHTFWESCGTACHPPTQVGEPATLPFQPLIVYLPVRHSYSKCTCAAAFCDLAQDLPDLSSLQKVSIHMPVVSSSVGLPHPCQLIDLVREGMLNESLMNDAMQERLHTLSLSSTFSLHADNLLRTRAAFCNSIWFLFGRPSCHLWVPAQVTLCLVNVVGIALQALLTIRWLGPVLCWMQPPWADSSLLISRLLSSQVPTAVHR